MNLHESIVAARNLLAERGHCKKVLEDDEGHVCLMGVFNLAVTGFPWYGGSDTEGFARALGFEPDDSFTATGAAVSWNNAPERTEEEVLLRLDIAALETMDAEVDTEVAAVL